MRLFRLESWRKTLGSSRDLSDDDDEPEAEPLAAVLEIDDSERGQEGGKRKRRTLDDPAKLVVLRREVEGSGGGSGGGVRRPGALQGPATRSMPRMMSFKKQPNNSSSRAADADIVMAALGGQSGHGGKRRRSMQEQAALEAFSSGLSVTGEELEKQARRQRVAQRQREFAAEVRAMRVLLGLLRRGWVLDPASRWMRRWDVAVVLCLVFTAIVTPYEVAVLPPLSYPDLDALFVFNRLVDFVFVTDMVRSFFTSYQQSTKKGSGWVRDQRKIARHYLRTWFTVDLVSVLPFDIVAYALGDSELGRLKAMRVFRLLRLLKLVRIIRANRIFKRWETSMSIQYSVLSLAKFSLLIVIVDHWMACAWALLAVNRCPLDAACVGAVVDSARSGGAGPEDAPATWLTQWLSERGTGAAVPSPHQVYTLAMYWAVMTLTSIGYGDIVPVTYEEHAWMTFFMLVGAVCWAYIIGSFCGVVSTLDLAGTEFRQSMDELNRFMKRKGVPHATRQSLRTYFHQARSLK
eukprot:g6798.t1